jgi:hypothetical protein
MKTLARWPQLQPQMITRRSGCDLLAPQNAFRRLNGLKAQRQVSFCPASPGSALIPISFSAHQLIWEMASFPGTAEIRVYPEHGIMKRIVWGGRRLRHEEQQTPCEPAPSPYNALN